MTLNTISSATILEICEQTDSSAIRRLDHVRWTYSAEMGFSPFDKTWAPCVTMAVGPLKSLKQRWVVKRDGKHENRMVGRSGVKDSP